MNKLRYSIIYAVVRPEISEQISVGLIFVDSDKVELRYSNIDSIYITGGADYMFYRDK